ncbi:MAG: hypothetical protein WC454_09260 [Phycisphaerae bacterium]
MAEYKCYVKKTDLGNTPWSQEPEQGILRCAQNGASMHGDAAREHHGRSKKSDGLRRHAPV